MKEIKNGYVGGGGHSADEGKSSILILKKSFL